MFSPVIRPTLAALLVASGSWPVWGVDPAPAAGGPSLQTLMEPAPSWAEVTENLGRLWHDPAAPGLQEFWLLGRYHGQFHSAHGSAGESQDWENRRYRMGAQARLLEKLTIHAQAISGSDWEPVYNGFTELWVQWAFHPALALTVGQQKHRFTHDRNVSSRYLNVFERSLLVNQFLLDYTPAVTLSGQTEQWAYYTGLFSNATSGNMGRAFTELDSGVSFLSSATLDLQPWVPTDTAHWNVGYLYSDAKESATNLSRFDHGVSTALILTEGPLSVVAEGLTGLAGQDGDAAALNLQLGYFVTDQWQVAFRYQVAGATQDDGLRGQRRYENAAGLTTGDSYQAAYLGVNYHIAAHRLKLMAGVEYATLGGEDLWTAMTGLRLFWGPHSRGPFPMAQTLKGWLQD
jgi:phosphate-selective porin OprO and OprP